MILRRHGRRYILTRPTPSVPPPLPLQLVFADEMSGEEECEWETVRDEELIALEGPAVISSETPFPLVTRVNGVEESGAAEGLGPDSILATMVAPQRSWPRYAAVAAAAVLALAAALLPVRWPRLSAPVIHAAEEGSPKRPGETVTYVVPITVVGDVPGQSGRGDAQHRRPTNQD